MGDSNTDDKVTFSLASAAASDFVTKKRGEIDLSLIGVSPNTVVVERENVDDHGNWSVVETYTADAEDAVAFGAAGRNYRVRVSVYVSGTVTGSLRA